MSGSDEQNLQTHRSAADDHDSTPASLRMRIVSSSFIFKELRFLRDLENTSAVRETSGPLVGVRRRAEAATSDRRELLRLGISLPGGGLFTRSNAIVSCVWSWLLTESSHSDRLLQFTETFCYGATLKPLEL